MFRSFSTITVLYSKAKNALYIYWDPRSLQKYCSIQLYKIAIRNIYIYTHTHTSTHTHTHTVIQYTNIMCAYYYYYKSIKCIKI